MKTILSYFTFFLTGFLLQAQNTINIEMSGFESNKGKANIGLFNEEETFLREANWKRFSEINNNKATATFTDIPDGIYAVSVYHDENDNEKLSDKDKLALDYNSSIFAILNSLFEFFT